MEFNGKENALSLGAIDHPRRLRCSLLTYSSHVAIEVQYLAAGLESMDVVTQHEILFRTDGFRAYPEAYIDSMHVPISSSEWEVSVRRNMNGVYTICDSVGKDLAIACITFLPAHPSNSCYPHQGAIQV